MGTKTGDKVYVLGEDQDIKWYADTGKLVVGNREFYPDNFWVKLLRFFRRVR